MGLLYALEFSSGKRYIGITSGQMPNRLRQHRSKVSRGSDSAVHSAWRKYGDPKAKVLAIADMPLLKHLEPLAIGAYLTLAPHGYNLTIGGEHPPLSEETRAKISAAHVGMKHTPATKIKMSLAKTGSHPNVSAEVRAQRSAAMIGNQFGVGYKATAEKSAMMSALMKGNQYWRLAKQTEESNAKRSVALTGIKRSDETRTRMSAGQKLAWERRRLAAVKK